MGGLIAPVRLAGARLRGAHGTDTPDTGARAASPVRAQVEGNGQAVAASAPGAPAGAKAASPPERRSAAQPSVRPAVPSQPAARSRAGAEAPCVVAPPAPQALPLRSAFAAAAGDASGGAGADDFAAPRTQLTCSTSASEHARVACRRTSSTGGLLIEPRPSQCIATCSRASSGGLPFELRGAELGDTRNMGSLGGLSMASSLSSPGRSAPRRPCRQFPPSSVLVTVACPAARRSCHIPVVPARTAAPAQLCVPCSRSAAVWRAARWEPAGSGQAPVRAGLTNMPVETPFEDLELRSLLSRGSIYGRLYQASWRGATVAVKARPRSASPGGPHRCVPGEDVRWRQDLCSCARCCQPLRERGEARASEGAKGGACVESPRAQVARPAPGVTGASHAPGHS